MNPCKKCGAPVFPGATDCPNCGHLVTDLAVAQPSSSGNLLFKLAALVAISPVLPLAVGFVGSLCGRAPGMDFLCASDGGYSIQEQGALYGVFGFLFTVPAGIVMALLGLLGKAHRDTDAPATAVNSQLNAIGNVREVEESDSVGRTRQRPPEPRAHDSAAVAVSDQIDWPLRAAGVALVALGVLCFAPFIYQDKEMIEMAFLGAFLMGGLGLSLLIGGAICLSRSTGKARSTAVKPVGRDGKA